MRRVARILRTSLFAQVACALVVAVVVGQLWPDMATDLQPLGDLGNCVAVVAVSRWEGALDLPRAKRVLDGKQPPAAPASPGSSGPSSGSTVVKAPAVERS
ncbi:hypothetical protein AB0465_35140 [Streptomyces griseoviridis]|nr:hypothetical protein [Streptomyces griseoviridis]